MGAQTGPAGLNRQSVLADYHKSFFASGAGISMKNPGSLKFALAALLMLLALPAHAEKRVALVIGNNDYKNVPKLQKAVNDATKRKARLLDPVPIWRPA